MGPVQISPLDQSLSGHRLVKEGNENGSVARADQNIREELS